MAGGYSTRTPVGGVKITSGVAFDSCAALWVGTAGTATIVSADGRTMTNFPLFQGMNEIQATNVTLGTASDVWAMYN